MTALENGRTDSGTPRLEKILWHLLPAVIGLPLITPLLRLLASPCTHDGHLHTHRIAAMRYAVENGLYLSRWLPDVAFGYGYPFFLYREAAPLYAALIPHLLGMPLPGAINLFYALTLLLSGAFMFLWVKDILGRPAAVVSAAAYMAAPYLLIDALVRGNQPESMALALFPLILWAGRRYVLGGSSATFLAGTFSLALLALSHNISLLLFVPLYGIYLLIVGWSGDLPWRRFVPRAVLVVGLALGLAAFYWAPAVLELDQVTISQSVVTRGNDFRFNFATLGEIFAPVSSAGPSLLNPPLPIRLGWVPTLLAIAGVAGIFVTRSKEQKAHIVMMALAAMGLILMSLEVALPLWERLPLIEFVQFPWRFIGRAALPVAFLAGVPFAVVPAAMQSGRLNRWLVPLTASAAVVCLLLEAMPNLYPRICIEEGWPTIGDVHQYEHETAMVGVDPTGSYFPTTVSERPSGSPLEADYAAGQTPRRFDSAVLPAGASLLSSEYQPTSATVVVESPLPFTARYLTFDFPGWVAMIDGEETVITPSDPEGLITFEVPAGRHTIEVRWRATTTRMVMSWLSFFSLAAVLGIAITLRRRQGSREDEALQTRPGSEKENDEVLSRRLFLAVLLATVLMLALKLVVIDRTETAFRQAKGPETSYGADLSAGGLTLSGYDLSRQEVPSGETFDIDLAWQVTQTPEVELQSNVWLADEQGLLWSEKGTERPRLYEEASRTTFWQPGEWAWDSREVRVLAGTPPGEYDLVLTLFDRSTLEPLTLRSSDGTTIGPMAKIGRVTVTVADEPAAAFSNIRPQRVLNEQVGDLLLFGVNQDRQEARPGDQMLLTFFWRVPADIKTEEEMIELQLLNEGGRSAQRWTIAPRLSAGLDLRSQHPIRLAAGLESGLYHFRLGGVSLGDLRIEAPERLMEQPAVQQVDGTIFGGKIELVGYSLEPAEVGASQQITITLVWRAREEVDTGYRVFVHLVDEAGAIIDQSDAEPAEWSRPTTGWVPGEYIVDKHRLELPEVLPAGGLWLRVGFYDADTGQRLDIAEGGEFVQFEVPRLES